MKSICTKCEHENVPVDNAPCFDCLITGSSSRANGFEPKGCRRPSGMTPNEMAHLIFNLKKDLERSKKEKYFLAEDVACLENIWENKQTTIPQVLKRSAKRAEQAIESEES